MMNPKTQQKESREKWLLAFALFAAFSSFLIIQGLASQHGVLAMESGFLQPDPLAPQLEKPEIIVVKILIEAAQRLLPLS